MMNIFENIADLFEDLMDAYAEIGLTDNDLDEDFEAMTSDIGHDDYAYLAGYHPDLFDEDE